ncbi:G-type lectin S-receptor-like serine/threonine-protein kinase LECRK3 [Macadamia integrifolia]|uniref:G-type lectin S-receptor-like serine/threonine-protein kinase LECRK3 n=1 Tax=Macadamia integrifolia TaxID=60698 RepID=UPI001C533FCB|nr:G-type lectin S-receptor-like serine/threonine-protein kinase LECRK3 [Macadamia integrifolia]
MASATFVFLPFLLLLLLVLSELQFCAAGGFMPPIPDHRIDLGSSLSPSSANSSWPSLSGRFAFGFYPQGNSGFAIGIWYAQIPQHSVVVWTPNPNYPPFSSNATLNLTSAGTFILKRTPQDREEYFVYDGFFISGAYMFDSGNFALFDSGQNNLWQSFDFPTNNLLPGQSLLPGQAMHSSVSETNHSDGRFVLVMEQEGNLVQYPSGKLTQKFAYWESATNMYTLGDYVKLNLDEEGSLYLSNSSGHTVKNLATGGTPINDTVFYRMTLDVDGIFRLYSIGLDDQKKSKSWSIMWESSTDKCVPIGICGMNAYCTYNPWEDKEAVCNCIPGFDFVDKTQQVSDCRLQSDHQQDCSGIQKQNGNFFMPKLEHVIWNEDPYDVLPIQTEGKCKEACLADSNCEVALFGDDDQGCRLQQLPLRYGRRPVNTSTATTLTFVRGRNCSSFTTPDTLPHYSTCFYVRLIHL